MADGVRVRFTADVSDFIASLDDVSDKTAQSTKFQQENGAEIEKVAKAYGDLRAALDPAVASANNFQRAMDLTNAALRTGLINDQQFAEETQKITEAFNGAADGAKKAGAAHGEFSLQTAGARREVIVLGHEILTGNFARIPGSLVVMAERAGGVSIGMLGVAGAVAAAGAVIAEMVIHAEQLDQELGTMQVGLEASGRGADYSREAMTGLIEQLRDIPGVSTKAAEQLITDFTRQRDIGVGSYASLGLAAAGYARATSEEVPKAGQTLVQTLEEGYGAILKLDSAWNFLSPNQRDQIQSLGLLNDRAGVLNIAIPALADHFGKFATEGMTPIQLATNAFGAAWDKLLGSLANTGPVEAARNAIARFLSDTARGMQNAADPGNLDHLKADLTALQTQRDRLAGEHDGSFLGNLNAPQSAIDALDQEIAKTKELIAAKQQAAASPTGQPGAGSTPAPNGENDPNVVIKQALTLEQQLGLEAAKREQIEGRIAELKKGAATASAQASKATANGDDNGAASYQGQATRLTADAAELQTQLDQLHAKGAQSRLQSWQSELDNQLLSQNKFGEQAKQAEVAFWSERLKETQAGSTDQLAVERLLYQARNTLQNEQAAEAKRAAAQEIADKLDDLKQQITHEGATIDQRVALLAQYQAAYTSSLVAGTTAFRTAKAFELTETLRIEDEKLKATEKGIEDQVKAIERQGTEVQRALDTQVKVKGSTDAQSLAQTIANLDREYAAERDLLTKEEGLAGLSLQDKQRITGELETLNDRYNNSVIEAAQKSLEAQTKSWDGVVAPAQRAIDQSVSGVLTGQQTASQAIARAAQSMITSYIGAGVQMVTNMAKDQLLMTTETAAQTRARALLQTLSTTTDQATINKAVATYTASETAKTSATAAGTTTRNSLDATENAGFLSRIGTMLAQWLGLETGKTAATDTGATERTTAQTAENVATTAQDFGLIEMAAAVAAANAFAALAAFPPAAAAAATAAWGTTMGFASGLGGGIASAFGGWGQVPYDGAMTELHKDEMVLPASIASPLRGMLAGFQMPSLGGAGSPSVAAAGGGGGGGDLHLNGPINISGASPSGLKGSLLSAMNDIARDGVPAAYPHLKRALGQ